MDQLKNTQILGMSIFNWIFALVIGLIYLDTYNITDISLIFNFLVCEIGIILYIIIFFNFGKFILKELF